MFTNSGINKVFLVGKIDKEPRLHNFTDQQEVLCFPLVTTEVIKKNSEDFDLTEFHNIKVPKELVSVSTLSLQKGQLIYLEGKIQTRSYFDDDHIKKYKLEIIAVKVQVLYAAEPQLQKV